MRVRMMQSPPQNGEPWIADLRTFDIPETIAACIRNAAPGLVAVTLSPLGGARMVRMAEHAARKRGVRILWWSYNPWKGETEEKMSAPPVGSVWKNKKGETRFVIAHNWNRGWIGYVKQRTAPDEDMVVVKRNKWQRWVDDGAERIQ